MFPTLHAAWWSGLPPDAALMLLAVTLDRVLPEPPARVHPVVWIGRTIRACGRLAPESPPAAFLYGCLVVLAIVGGWGVLTWLVVTVLSGLGVLAYVLGGAIVMRTSFTVRGLVSAGEGVGRALEEKRLDDARERLAGLVSRSRDSLGAPLVAAAAIESVAENTTDSYIAPWLAFALLGVPGAVAYRAVNTMDSMWGTRGRHEYLGKCAARLDDAVNLVPARLSAVLLLGGGALAGLPMGRGWRVMWRDRRLTASPNAGWTMAAMSGLLGRRLEKPAHYDLGAEFTRPEAQDIGRGNRAAGRAALLGIVAALCVLALRHWITA